MKTIAVITGATPTKVADPGNFDFAHIYNDSDTTIYLGYDGDAATVTTENGFPLQPTGLYTLENAGPRQLFRNGIYAIHGAGGSKTLRVQGV